jgi:phage baseplate assembly protein W
MTAVLPSDARIYGQGVAFPLQVGPDGRMSWSAGETNVRESILLLLRTELGERILRSDFGCGLERHLHQPVTLATLRLLQDEVTAAIGRWEPRVRLDDVSAVSSVEDPRAVDLTITFTLVATGVQQRVGLTVAPTSVAG